MPKPTTESEKDLMAFRISNNILDKLGICYDQKKVRSEMDKADKMGTTNYFFTLDVDKDKSILVRVNGTLWPPYTRESEDEVLQAVQRSGVNTGVLANPYEYGYQLADAPELGTRLSEILERVNSEEKKILLSIVSETVAHYHAINSYQDIEYPIAKMLQDATVQAERKAKTIGTESSKTLSFFSEVSFRVLSTLYANAAKEGHVFSHNDLLTKSVIIQEVPTQGLKLTVVDWEYSGRANWSTDLAKLCVNLEPIDVEQVGSAYIDKKFGDAELHNTTKYSMKIELELNRFLHGYLELLWRYNSKIGFTNETLEPWVQKLQEQLASTYLKIVPIGTFQKMRKSLLAEGSGEETTINEQRFTELFGSQESKITDKQPLAIEDKKPEAASEHPSISPKDKA